MNKNVDGINVPEAIISRMEIEGATGIEITYDLIREIVDNIDGIDIMVMGM